MKQVILTSMLVLTVSLQYRLWIGEGSLAHASGLMDQVQRMQSENRSMSQRNAILKAEIIDLRSGLDAIEEKARSDFGLIKQNETFFLLVDE
ncbi:MAG TPA: cell division protein FtsB [Gammaproteobacteria bacterium]|nr:cell division protein FtsB [Gammaproteobacteria bacterium]